MTAPSGLVIFIFFYEEGMERGGDTALVANMATQAFAAGLFVTDPPSPFQPALWTTFHTSAHFSLSLSYGYV